MKIPIAFSFACCAFLKSVSSTPLDERSACKTDNLLNALVNRIPDSYQFCSAYISVAATSTVTVYTVSFNLGNEIFGVTTDLRIQSTCILSSYIQVPTIVHPINLYNLQPQPFGITPSPLLYNTASPTPIKIPGGPQNYVAPGARRAKRDDTPNKLDSELISPTEPTVPKELIRRATPTLPSYLATTYPPSRISSACSCLSVPAATKSTVYRASLSTTFVRAS